MLSRLLLVTTVTAVLLGGAFVVRRTPPIEAVAASSVLAPPAGPPAASVSVVTEVVAAQRITTRDVAARPSHSMVRARPAQKRSLLARVLLGTGETRPQPFPRPGPALSAKP